MPTYNVRDYVSDAIVSIINQTYKSWELIITDDCSTDDTWEKLIHFARKDNRIKLFKLEKNSGAGAARNNSILNANGRFIAFCDSDDWWYPYKLEVQMDFIIRNNYKFIFSACEFTNSKLELIGISWKKSKIKKRTLLYESNIGTSGVIYDTKDIGKIYFPLIRKRQDWVMWIRIIDKTKNLYCINWPLWKCRIRDGSLTSNKINLVKHVINVYKIEYKYNIVISIVLFIILYMSSYIYRSIKNIIDSKLYIKSYTNKNKRKKDEAIGSKC